MPGFRIIRFTTPNNASMPHQPNPQTEAHSHLPTSRRQALGVISLATLGLASPSLHASSSPRRIDLSHLPPEWYRLQGQTLVDYTRFIANLNLRYITPEQVIESHAKSAGGVWNSLPPRNWWNRMGYTLRVVDRVALHLSSPVKKILSAYRSPAYNRHCAGARAGSWHQANLAVDVVFHASPSSATKMARSLRDRGLFKGGIGSYPTFTHIDARGENINW